MRKSKTFRLRFLSGLLALLIVAAMIPFNVISAFASTEKVADKFTVSVTDSSNNPVDKAEVNYVIKVDGSEQKSGKAETDKGVAAIEDMDSIDFSDSGKTVTLSLEVKKTGYKTASVNDEAINDPKGNVDVKLEDKEKVEITFSVKDSVSNDKLSNATVTLKGYEDVSGNTANGEFKASLYKDEKYSIEVTKDTYKKFSAASIKFLEDATLDISLEQKLADDSFKFAVAEPESIEYGDNTFVNTASSEKRSGTVIYSVKSGDCVTVDSASGAVTTLKAGTATIQAVMAEDDDYQEAKITYQLTVRNAADAGFGFTDPTPPNRKYQENDTYTNIAEGGSGTGEVTYKVTSGNAASVDSKTGVLTILNAGTVEVTATRKADSKYSEVSASYTLTIEKAEQAAISFEEASPADQYITKQIYRNRASGGSGKGKITYSIVAGSEFAEIKQEMNSAVTLLKAGGPVTVRATRSGDKNYEPGFAEYTFYIVKSPQTELHFETTQKTITYEPELTFSNPISGGDGNGETTYEIISGDAATINPNTGEMNILKASDEQGVVVRATKAGDDNYEPQTAEFTLIINKAEQTGFAFEDGETVSKVWSPDNNTYTNTASGGQSTGVVSFSLVGEISEMPYGGPCASFDSNTGAVTMYGKGSVTVKAVKAGDDCYEPAEAQYTLSIERAEQAAFGFEASVPQKLTYNDNDNEFKLSTYGGSGNSLVTYSVSSGDAVSVNNNVVTVNKAGVVKLRADKADTNTYNAISAEIEVEIEKANQEIKFEDLTTESIIYGNDYSNKANPVVKDNVPDARGYAALTPITYSVVDGSNIASVDSEGKLLFNNNMTGKVTVQASKAGDDCYNDTTASYSIMVKFTDVPDVPYTLSGDKINESGWYTGDVTITPAAGCKISYSNNLIQNNWQDNLVVPEEGYNAKTVYLKNEKGVSGAISISGNDIRIDKSTPKNLKITYSKSVIDTVFETASFGFYKAPLTVTIEAEDDISNIASFKYSYGENNGTLSGDKITYSNNNKKATASFEIPAQYRGDVSFTAVDTAGNEAQKHDDKVVVVDDIAPGMSISFDNNNAFNSTFFAADRIATIRIDEANFFTQAFDDSHLVIKVKKVLNNGQESVKVYKNSELTEPFEKINENSSIWEAKLLFSEDADYVFSVEYSDFSGNAAPKYETSFTIDKTKPEISISYDNNDCLNENCYKADRKATVKIIEHNFRASDINVAHMITKDVQGNDVDVSKDYQKLLREGKWTDDGDVHTLEIPFDKDAKYDFEITYSDLAENAQVNPITDTFVVDKAAPYGLSVSYSKSVINTMLENLTFGFYNAPVTVTITADDVTSGVDYFTYSYGVQVGASSVNSGKGDTVIPTGDIVYSDSGKKATASFEIPPQFRGSVSFNATDKAGNTSETFNDKKVIVVDDVAPGVTVSYNKYNALNGIYYNANRTATITIDEANFFKDAFEKVDDISNLSAEKVDEHLVITVTETDNNDKSVTKVIKSADLTTPFKEVSEDKWEATLRFDKDADYTWSIEYKDFSGNTANKFTDSFTIDKIKPELSVEYDNNDFLNKDHYNKNRTATVSINEHNFRPDEILVYSIKATDIQGKDVDYSKNYQQMLRTATWTHKGNVHTATIPFDVDARYKYEIKYSDLAGNNEAKPLTDEFCVDKVAPSLENMKISYSTSIFDTIIDAVTFGFYNAPVTVTLEADDEISGIDYLTYSYVVSDGESSKNKGKSDVVINSKAIKYSDDNKHATATFQIPPEFRGNVMFTATDRAGNTSDLCKDSKVIVVDTVAPGVNVSYNSDKPLNDTFYKHDRTATITIDEANFFAASTGTLDDISVTPSESIDKHLVITVTKTDINDNTETKVFKNAELTSPFKKVSEDRWEATLLFGENADYTWSIEYRDFSGKSAGKFTDSFTVDKINPVINVNYGAETVKNGKFFKGERTAEITVEERNFNSADFKCDVKVKKNVGDIPDYAEQLKDDSNWTHSGNTHKAKITFNTQAYYTFDVSYSDLAGNANDTVNYGKSLAPTDFVIDDTKPINADITINKESVVAKNGVAFEKYYKSSVTAVYTVNCDISGLDNIKYQKVDNYSDYSKNGEWETPDFVSKKGSVKCTAKVDISPNERAIIFFRAEDKSGNVEITNTTGLVVDDKKPGGKDYSPDIFINPDKPENGFYHSNVKVGIKVIDPAYIDKNTQDNENGYYSGLKKITYKIKAEDTGAVKEGTLFNLDDGDNKNQKRGTFKRDKNNLIKTWTGGIKINAQKFNSNKVVVEIYAVDNAGNSRITNTKMLNKPIKIDVTKPTISVTYADGANNGDETFMQNGEGAFFKNNRTATIRITERNFDEKKVTVKITNTDEVIPKLSSWVSRGNQGANGDLTVHEATVTYSADGDYTFSISCRDKATNKNSGVNYNGALSPKKFTIDKTPPRVNITFDNNSASNSNYYKAQRTATITIDEHNFETTRIIRTPVVATDNGRGVTAPAISAWSGSGDRHTATITFSADAHYVFNFDYTDKAGNKCSKQAEMDFYVDKEAPKLEISGVIDKSANNDEGNIGFTISATDTNLGDFEPSLTAIVKSDTGFSTKKIEFGDSTGINNGKQYTVENLESDGIYRIKCSLGDKAGNAFKEVTLYDKNDDSYVENRSGDDVLLTFSVNRNGSVFGVDNSTSKLLKDYYVRNVENDVVVEEINADTLNENKITLNSKPLKKTDYYVAHEANDGEWNRYVYKIKKSLFEKEGEYNIVVSSKDRATNKAFSDVKDTKIQFVVDKTPPVVTVTGLADDGRYQTTKQVVTIVPTDDGGELKSIKVNLVDENGKDVKELLNLSGKEFAKALEDGEGKLEFEIPEGLYQNVKVVCDDMAMGKNDKNNIYKKTYTNVSVTTSAFLIFWANKPLRYGVIGGIVLVIAGIITLIVLKKKKKKSAAAG